MADKYWFKHDYNARNDEKLMELRAEYGAKGYGIFWMLLEKMAETDKGTLDGRLMGGMMVDLNVPKKDLQVIIDFCIKIGLFQRDSDGLVSSKRMQEHKEMRKNLSESGKKGVQTREANRVAKGSLKGGLTQPSTDKIRKDNIKKQGAAAPNGQRAGNPNITN